MAVFLLLKINTTLSFGALAYKSMHTFPLWECSPWIFVQKAFNKVLSIRGYVIELRIVKGVVATHNVAQGLTFVVTHKWGQTRKPLMNNKKNILLSILF